MNIWDLLFSKTKFNRIFLSVVRGKTFIKIEEDRKKHTNKIIYLENGKHSDCSSLITMFLKWNVCRHLWSHSFCGSVHTALIDNCSLALSLSLTPDPVCCNMILFAGSCSPREVISAEETVRGRRFVWLRGLKLTPFTGVYTGLDPSFPNGGI